MSGNVSAGSILNQRVFTRQNRTAGSGSNGGGVKRNTLAQARVIIGANRTRVGGTRASYTQLSNMINGRKEVIYAGGHSCGSCSGEMSTMDKVSAYMAIAQQGLMFAQGLKQLFASPKATQSGNAGGTGNANGAGGANGTGTRSSDISTLINNNSVLTGSSSDNAAGVNDLSMTLNMISLTDIDYDGNADDFIDAMKDADNSQELYQAIQNGKVYRGQVHARITSLESQVSTWKADLEKITGDSETSLSEAKKLLSTAQDDVSSAESTVRHGENAVQSARQSYNVAKSQFEGVNEEFKSLSERETQATQNFDNCRSQLSTAEENQRVASSNLNSAKGAYSTAQANTKSAQDNVNAIKAQPESAAKTAQLAAANAQLDAAQRAEQQAKTQLEAASEKSVQADNAQIEAKNNLDVATTTLKEVRASLTAKAKELAGTDVNMQRNAELLENRTNSLQEQENRLVENQKILEEKRDTEASYQDVVDGLERKKEELEIKIKDFEEMKEARDDLDDCFEKYGNKLNRMLQQEGRKEEDLLTQLNEQNARSNNSDVSDRGRSRAERREVRTSQRLTDLRAGSALDDIARDQAAAGANGEKAWMPSGVSFDAAGTLSVNDDNASGNGDGDGFDEVKTTVGAAGFSTVVGRVAVEQQAGNDDNHSDPLSLVINNRDPEEARRLTRLYNLAGGVQQL